MRFLAVVLFSCLSVS